MLMFAGADSMAANASSMGERTTPVLDLSSIAGIVGSIFAGGGAMQIAAAVLLFLAAGKSMARFAGLMLVGGMFFLHMRGVTLGEASTFIADVGARTGAAVSAFQSARI